MIFLY